MYCIASQSLKSSLAQKYFIFSGRKHVLAGGKFCQKTFLPKKLSGKKKFGGKIYLTKKLSGKKKLGKKNSDGK